MKRVIRSWLFFMALSFALVLAVFLWPAKLKPPPPQLARDFTVVMLPDTQGYSALFPSIFEGQTEWIVNQKQVQNLVFVSHSGDIVDGWDDQQQWQNAEQALSRLEGVLPFGFLAGNHDDPDQLNHFFPLERFQEYGWWGGCYQKDCSSNYQFFVAGGMNFLVLHLKYNPSDKLLAWADEILKKYPERRAILTTHYFLDYDGFRSPLGNRIFDELADNPGLFLVLCGHIHWEARRTDLVDNRPIHQLLADYQKRPNGGNGWLRLLKFSPAENKIYVSTYSPFLDEYETDLSSQFELDYEMD